MVSMKTYRNIPSTFQAVQSSINSNFKCFVIRAEAVVGIL